MTNFYNAFFSSKYKKIKTRYLFITPFLIIVAIVISEEILFFKNNSSSFNTRAKNTVSIYEKDFSKFEKRTIVNVIDGDTVELENGEKVRYIGVDTPETKHPRKKVECYGKEAAKKNKELVLNKEVLLEKDVSERDRYERLLRYIYLPNPNAETEAIFVNELLIEQGYAQVISYPPDVKYKDLLLKAQKKAQTEGIGLWKNCKN